jgi:dihydropteroate synthase
MTQRPQLIGILNLTPDSFSDGGLFESAESVHKAVVQMLTDGADLIDIGAESTRPWAMPITAKEEWARLSPALQLLAKDVLFTAKISIDTRHGETAERALDLGISIINDVSGGADETLVRAVAAAKATYIFMHSLTIPANPLVVLPKHIDVVETLIHFANAKLAEFADAGIATDKMIFDPGIGFNKDADQSIQILKRVREFEALPVPLLVGHSRKSFLKQFTHATPKDRDALTLTTSAFLASQNVAYLRVHNIPAHFEMLNLWQALQS